MTIETQPCEIVQQFGRNVAVARKRLGWSYRALAERSDVNYSTLHAIEHGERGTTLASAVRIARALRVPLEELVSDSTTCATCYGRPPAGFKCLGCGGTL